MGVRKLHFIVVPPPRVMFSTENHSTLDILRQRTSLYVQVERIHTLYQQAGAILTGNLIVAAILAAFLYQITQDVIALYWIGGVASLTAIRYWLVVCFRKRQLSEKGTIRWGWYFALFALVSGVTWGLVSILFMPSDDIPVLLSLLMTVTGIVAASSAALSSFVWAYYFFSTSAVLPFIYMLVSTGNPGFIELGAMFAVFLVVQISIARKNQLMLDSSIILRHENVALVQDLRKKNTKLESANAAKTRFLAAASHDLRQPLHAMNLFVEALVRGGQDGAQAQILGKLMNSSSVLAELLESLLDISRLDAGVVSVNVAPFRVQKLFDILRNEFELMAETKGLKLVFMPSSLWINSDEKLVARILRNLVSNAIRYTHSGKVLVGCRRNSDTVTLVVGDTGIGIDPDNMEVIFEEFRQLNNSGRDRNHGLGLGLSIVKRLTELLGAGMSLRSRPDSGSIFSIILPRSSPYECEMPQPLSFEPGTSLAGKLVVVVEDEEEIRHALRLVLSGWGGEVIEAASVSDIMPKLAQAKRPDLILVDYRLYGPQTGIDVIRAIHAHCNDDKIPTVIITGDTAPEKIREVKNSGFLMLHKPISGGKLLAILNSVLRHI